VRIFIDTGSVAEVEEIAQWGVLAGATTNPSLLAKEDGDPGEIVKRICELVGGPVSAEVISDDAKGMIEEGRALRELHEHVTVKVPFSEAGLEAAHALTSDGIPVNMTLVFSPSQALLAASAGATYVSCFMGRLDDISIDSVAVVGEIVEAFRAGGGHLADHRGIDPPPRARRGRGQARLRDRHGAGQGAAPDAEPPADHGGRREVQGRLGDAARVRGVAQGPRGGPRRRAGRVTYARATRFRCMFRAR